MKKIMLICACICAMCSCVNDSYFDTKNVEEIPVKAQAKKKNVSEFFAVCVGIINVHKDLELFQNSLPKKLAKKMARGNYSEKDAVEIIYTWYTDEECGDILCEWPEFDLFLELLPEMYREKYHFCC